jgi:hypothetical protein
MLFLRIILFGSIQVFTVFIAESRIFISTMCKWDLLSKSEKKLEI